MFGQRPQFILVPCGGTKHAYNIDNITKVQYSHAPGSKSTLSFRLCDEQMRHTFDGPDADDIWAIIKPRGVSI